MKTLHTCIIRPFRKQDYQLTLDAMRTFTRRRVSCTPDEIWLIEHDPIYTLGQASNQVFPFKKTLIPIQKTDRGGQITYHGPGQLLIYTLLDLHRLHLNIRQLLDMLEQSMIRFLANYHIKSHTCLNARGVYVSGAKIASIGLRIHKGRCYHGMSLNIAMDLNPFLSIHPCGQSNLRMTQLQDLGGPSDFQIVSTQYLSELIKALYFSK